MLLIDALALHHRHLVARRRSPLTLAWYDEQFQAYLTWAAGAGVGPGLPDAATLDAFLAQQHAAGLRPSTVHARYRALRALFLFLEKRRQLRYDDNPIRLVEPPSVPRVARRYVGADELTALLATCRGDWLGCRDRLALLLLFYSGLRVAELCGLAVADVDPQELTVLVRQGKGEKARAVPCHPDVAPALIAYLYTRPNHRPELLLASDGFGGVTGALTKEGVRQMLKRRCRQAGIAYYSPHAFRHGFAMWTLNAGVRLTTVSTLMGHSDPNVTHQIYAHTTAVAARAEYEAALRKTQNR